MNLKDENVKLIYFWNQFFDALEPSKIDLNDLKTHNTLEEYLKELGDASERILDIGTGAGYCLINAMLLGSKVKYGLGIDPSENAIEYAKKTCELSDISDIELKVGDHRLLDKIEDGFFDGIVCSNVLDVVPEETSNEIIKEIIRLLKPGGLFVLKLNFFLTEELIKKIGMEEVAQSTYKKDGIIRGLNFSTEAWTAKFDGLNLIKSGTYERIKKGPKDRVLMFKKHIKGGIDV